MIRRWSAIAARRAGRRNVFAREDNLPNPRDSNQ